MKKGLFILSLLFLTSCGLFEENRRGEKYTLRNGRQVSVEMSEIKYPLLSRNLKVYVTEDFLKGKYCEDEGLRNLGNEIWAEVVRQNDLSEINSGMLQFMSNQGQATPYICIYTYSKKRNGEWGKNNESSVK